MIDYFVESWADVEGNVNKTSDLLKWVQQLNENTKVNIKETSIFKDTFWFYDDYMGEVLNRKRSFFSIKGVRFFENHEFVKEQPIINQPEIGYLGIIGKIIDGKLNFLMQGKIEPGNINCVQVSPTIQATKSNFTRAHGGKSPAYLEYFENSSKYIVVYDQIQSEQSSRFLKKRNRNMIMLVQDEIPVLQNFKWMTLGQIKELMKIDNLVNMDTRTVLSGIPFILESPKQDLNKYFKDKALYNSIFLSNDIQKELVQIYHKINNYKMFKEISVVQTPLNQLVDWTIDEYGITCTKTSDFMVKYYDIEISGREVQCWFQPLFKAIGCATFALITKLVDNKRKFLVRIKPEIGCFDKIELSPSIQWEPSHNSKDDSFVDKYFRMLISESHQNCKILFDSMLSEEGGRFYHEQNRNMIVEIDSFPEELNEIDEYIWCDLATLNFLTQINNCLNIQLRNLISLLPL